MTTSRRSPVFDVVSGLLMLASAAVLLRQAALPLYELDLWWHLRLGEQYLADWSSIRNPEPLTRFATEDWFSASWLPEMVFAWIEQAFGLPGVAWVYGAGLLALLATIYLVARHRSDPLVSSLITFITVAAASGTLTPRPQLLSYTLLAVSAHAWLKTADDLKPRWWLVPMTWIWAMAHGMWLTGIFVGVGVILGLALDRRLDRGKVLRLIGVPTASLAAAAVTPQGPRNLMGFIRSVGWQDYISEYAPPSFDDPLYLLALVLLAVVLITHARTRRRLSWAHLAILVQAAIWMLYSVRSIAWGAVMVAPLAAATMQTWLPRRDQSGVGRVEAIGLAGAATIGLAALALVVPHTANEPRRMPNELNDELAAIQEDSAILNDYGLGGWIEWRHRHLAPVIDGQTNQYRLSDMEAYDNVTDVGPGWDDYVAEKGVTSALLPEDSPLATALEQRLNWQVVDADEGFALLIAPDA